MYLQLLMKQLPAIESSHALAEAIKRAPKLDKNKIIIVNISGRGDKDVVAIAEYLKNCTNKFKSAASFIFFINFMSFKDFTKTRIIYHSSYV